MLPALRGEQTPLPTLSSLQDSEDPMADCRIICNVAMQHCVKCHQPFGYKLARPRTFDSVALTLESGYSDQVFIGRRPSQMKNTLYSHDARALDRFAL